MSNSRELSGQPYTPPFSPDCVSVATRNELRLREGDGARAKGRGCFGSSRSPSFLDPVVYELGFLAPFPFPFPSPAAVFPPSFPAACLPFFFPYCPGSGPFSGPGALRCAAPGPSI